MRARLKGRLDRIEKALPKPPTAPCPDVIPKVESWLASVGIVRGANESLAETTMRALGISAQELQSQLRQRAGFGA
jgi:hypothetical protein